MAGVFPGANDIETYWRNIVDKVPRSAEIPEDRCLTNPEDMYAPRPAPDKLYSRRACLIRDFEFDPSGFRIDPDLLLSLDPLYHLLLQAGKSAFDQANVHSLAPYRIGTVIAAIALPTQGSSALCRRIVGKAFESALFKNQPVEYERISRNDCLAARVTGFPAAILAGALGASGGCYTLDAACASSLYSVYLACETLVAKRADAMIAGGVSRPDCFYTQVGFSQLRALSPSGRCAPFDKTADGLVVGEGAGVLILKRLEDAVRAKDEVLGIIRGVGLSNDIRGALLAPDSEGQVRAMRQAYKAAGWAPWDVGLIECHGAGTPVGDRTESRSLVELWNDPESKKHSCAIGSVKSMIGHLLTAAGSAGLIKALLALKHRTLPPSLNFSEPPDGSPLFDSQLYVQTEPEPWNRKDGHPLRAAVSAFGFGGVNAHLLIEEARDDTLDTAALHIVPGDIPKAPSCAVTGLDACFGTLSDGEEFKQAVFTGRSILKKRPENRFKGGNSVAEQYLSGRAGCGAFLETGSKALQIDIGRFRIPPNEIPDIFTQQLLMLEVAARAMEDAGLPLSQERPRMGCVIGIDFDMEATHFHLRWNLHNEVRRWKSRFDLNGEEARLWLSDLQDAVGPPLTHSRTLGALGGIVASRIAREFRFGGPGFVISEHSASGIRAIEIAVRMLQRGIVDAMLVGAVDIAGDVRNMVSMNGVRPFSVQKARPFESSAGGVSPCEGAAAVVLQRTDDVRRENKRIYAVIKGLGFANKIEGSDMAPAAEIYRRSLDEAFHEAGVSAGQIGYIEAAGGDPADNETESEVLSDIFSGSGGSAALGSIKGVIGHSGAAASMASVVKTALCLRHETFPPLPEFVKPADNRLPAAGFHVPRSAQYWIRDRADGPRKALAADMTWDGNCAHIILEQNDTNQAAGEPVFSPVVPPPSGLFVVTGESPSEIAARLDRLKSELPLNGRLSAAQYAAKRFHDRNDVISGRLAAVVVADRIGKLPALIDRARNIVLSGKRKTITAADPIAFSPDPLGPRGDTAFVYPGSGNHYIGMGRGIGVHWPEILHKMDSETARLKTQMQPECFAPWNIDWEKGWESRVREKIASNPLHMIYGQVVHAGLMTELLTCFGISPSAVIGYSLGESAGYFAMKVWPERGEMLKRMKQDTLFSRDLAGPCMSARKAWNIAENEPFEWRAAVVNRSAEVVKSALASIPRVRLLIVNTQDESVIGGEKEQAAAVIREMKCEAVYLEGVVTVHCDAAEPAAEQYRNLHLFPVQERRGVRFYSCAYGRPLELTTDNTADSILAQALHGFDFPKTVRRAYDDGVRTFIELGPKSSCTRMIGRILEDREHLAVSACVQGEDEYFTIMKLLGNLIAERVPVDIAPLFKNLTQPSAETDPDRPKTAYTHMNLGCGAFSPPRPQTQSPPQAEPVAPKTISDQEPEPAVPAFDTPRKTPVYMEPDCRISFDALIGPVTDRIEAVAGAHRTYLEFHQEQMRNLARTCAYYAELVEDAVSGGEGANRRQVQGGRFKGAGSRGQVGTRIIKKPEPCTLNPAPCPLNPAPCPLPPEPCPLHPEIAFSREMCMEFAIGSLEKVLGPEFAVVDTYDARVRLPDEPLMLVDRILSVEGQKGSMGSGKVVTEHDVRENAWYLDGGRAPVCISVEAGQADLFLCSYLGIDLMVKGKRTYRLLDAEVTFHRGLPEPGEVIRYEINIDKFVRQGETWLFFFRFEGTIGDQRLITMKDGCAGFFTKEEVQNSGGVILKAEEKCFEKGRLDYSELVPLSAQAFDERALDALRQGDMEGAFGGAFKGIFIPDALRLPAGRMTLIDRIPEFDPTGGGYGCGVIRAEADIHPDDWFLTCHFVDDMVMPGTLMYECCAHTLRVFLQRIGWITDREGVCYEPVIGMSSALKCRGPVTPETKKVVYEVEIREIGYGPEPFAVGDAHMYTDGQEIVYFKNISLKMTGIGRREIENFWADRKPDRIVSGKALPDETKKILYDRRSILAFAVGKPSEAFGEPYRIFDKDRTIARLPGPPYCFMDRIVNCEPEPWKLEPGGWVEAEYDIPPDAWYFKADRTGFMPYCVLQEIALQPCGWLAAYMGSALNAEKDLKFRNLGGRAVMKKLLYPDSGTVKIRVRATKISEAAEMIIEYFDMQVLNDGEVVYEGDTYFGFFTKAALAQQVGVRGASGSAYQPNSAMIAQGEKFKFENQAPATPDDSNQTPFTSPAMPAKALRMVDEIDSWIPGGGSKGLGFIRGVKHVDPDEWFFQAHFYQDPVCPGSLGVESFLQILKFAALKMYPEFEGRGRFRHILNSTQQWIYRGQIIQKNKRVEIDADIVEIIESPDLIQIFADGFVKVDGLFIYQLDRFAVGLSSQEQLRQ